MRKYLSKNVGIFFVLKISFFRNAKEDTEKLNKDFFKTKFHCNKLRTQSFYI